MNFQKQLIALKTILIKEIIRVLRIWPQSLIPPFVTTSLYFIIFGKVLFKDRNITILGETISYSQYLIPGLVMMAIITNSYNNTVASFFGCKFQRNVEDLIVSPVPIYIVILGFALGGVFRGLINGLMVFATAALFEPISVNSLFMTLFVALFTAMFFSLAGMINAVFAKTFDDISWFPAFILTPMVYLGGVFFSIDMLSGVLRIITKFNPVYQFVYIFRHSLLGVGSFSLVSLITIIFFNIVLFVLTNFFFKSKMQK